MFAGFTLYAVQMDVMKVAPWHAQTSVLDAHVGQQILFLTTRHPKRCSIQARAKRISSKKQSKEKPLLAPSEQREDDNGQAFSSSNDCTQGASLLPQKTKTNRIRDEVSSTDFTDASSSSKRLVVLKACVSTCAAIFAAGILLQQVTHLAAQSGWSVSDSQQLVNYHVESWYLEVMLGLVLTISLSRQLLLRTWPEFSESSNSANNEVLGSLTWGDYFVVAILPGVSEEMLFRGALLPLVGLDWRGAAVTGLLFGVLHMSGGRKTAFAMWASVVGLLYGLACIATHSVLVPMAAHSANNLVGAFIWRSQQQQSVSNGD